MGAMLDKFIKNINDECDFMIEKYIKEKNK